jgi:hypothetical protein
LHFTNQNTTTISFSVYHCIAYYFSLHAIRNFLALLHLHIYFQFCILTHTLCLTTTWWGWGHKANLFTLQVVRRETGRIHLHSFPRVWYKPSSHPCGEKPCFPVLNTLLLESQPSGSIRIFFWASLPGN